MGIAIFNCCEKNNEKEPVERLSNQKTEISNLSSQTNEQSDKLKPSTTTRCDLIMKKIQLDKLSLDNNVKIKTENFINENTSNPADSYERICAIGEGGFSHVIKVRHSITKDIRAMKIIKRQDVKLGGLTNKNIENECITNFESCN